MKVAALCPTYGRPLAMLRNTLALWMAQDYPLEKRRLIILDDLGNLEATSGDESPEFFNGTPMDTWQDSVRICVRNHRIPSLSLKYNAMLQMVPTDYDAVVVWEDDDVYLPWHIRAHVHALQGGKLWSHPQKVWSTYDETGTGKIQEESAAGRMHASLAFRRDFLVDTLKGWPDSKRADFDQQLIANARREGGPKGQGYPDADMARSYVFRWNDTGDRHGQHFMRGPADEGWYDRAAAISAPHYSLEQLGLRCENIPEFDASTARLIRILAARASGS